jgi:hypothetical protein
MTNIDKEILLIYNRLQQISVIIENVFDFNHKVIEVLEQHSEFNSKIYLKTTEVISQRLTILEELAAIFTKLHETEIDNSKLNDLIEKARNIDEEYIKNLEIIRQRAEFETKENKLLSKELESLERDIKNLMIIFTKKIDKKKAKLEVNDEK